MNGGVHHRITGNGPLAVLLHPVGLDGTFWGELPAFLGQTHAVAAVDLKGHGESPPASSSLSAIACPTFIVAGGKDGLLPPADHACPMHAAIAGSELTVIDDAAHFIPYQRPEEFAAQLAEFLVRRLAARR